MTEGTIEIRARRTVVDVGYIAYSNGTYDLTHATVAGIDILDAVYDIAGLDAAFSELHHAIVGRLQEALNVTRQ